MRGREIEALRKHSIRDLEALVKVAQEVIRQKQAAPDEFDVAREHSGEPELTADVLETKKQGGGRTREFRKIYCSRERCPRCPHGPYWYSIRENKRRRTRVVHFRRAPVFSRELVETIRQQAKPLAALLQITPRVRRGRAQDTKGSKE